MSPTITSIDGKFYDSNSGIELDEDKIEEAKKYQDNVENRLALSDKVVNGDLLRFYTPENFIQLTVRNIIIMNHKIMNPINKLRLPD